MIFYYLIWAVISFFSFFMPRGLESRLVFLLLLFGLFLMSALRYEIGGDWSNYLLIYDYFKDISLSESLKISDPAYGLINYFGQQLGFMDTLFVNFSCALIFYLCFYYFIRDYEYYWQSLLVAFPYLIVVVSMGYTRQSVAIMLSLLALKFAFNKRLFYFFIFLFLAISFHKSAMMLFIFTPLFFMAKIFKQWWVLLFYAISSFLFISIAVYFSSLTGENIYTDQTSDVSSSGALFRITSHFLAVIFYLIYRKEVKRHQPERVHLFDYMVLLVFYVFMLAIPFSTLADRFNLYLISFDLFIFSILCALLNGFNRQLMIGLIVFFNSLMLIIWMSFGVWSHAWLPYKNYLIDYFFGVV